MDVKKLQAQRDRLAKRQDPVTRFQVRQKRNMARLDRLIAAAIAVKPIAGEVKKS